MGPDGLDKLHCLRFATHPHDVDGVLAADGPVVPVVVAAAGEGRRLAAPAADCWGTRGLHWRSTDARLTVD
jgi:hypothetical protein